MFSVLNELPEIKSWNYRLQNSTYRNPLKPFQLILSRHNIFIFTRMELFPIERKYPAGFQYVPDFITTEEEDYLLDAIGRIALHTFNFHGFEAKRRVASFGYDYSFSNRTLTKGEPIPTAFDPLLSKVSLRLNIPKEEFVELLVTEYPLGSVINWQWVYR
jgi:hypothetical protein